MRMSAKLYHQEFGVYANMQNLSRWILDQELGTLQNNEDHHANPAGPYVYQRLQEGGKPAEIVEEVLRKFLVKTSRRGISAYRRFREQRGPGYDDFKLEMFQWPFLHERVAEPGWRKRKREPDEARLAPIRAALCEELALSEELMPSSARSVFYQEHEHQANLPKRYDTAVLVKDSISWTSVEAYRSALKKKYVYPMNPQQCASFRQPCGKAVRESFHEMVAEQFKLIIWPLASAYGCMTVAPRC